MVAVVLCGAQRAVCAECECVWVVGDGWVEQVKGNRSVRPGFTMHRSKGRK